MRENPEVRPFRRMPVLHTDVLPEPRSYAGSTCASAGYLVSCNAGWRSSRPVIDAARCMGCLKCYMYCPDGTLYRTHAPSGEGTAAVAVDLGFCKGCGICAKVCPFDAIDMVVEREV